MVSHALRPTKDSKSVDEIYLEYHSRRFLYVLDKSQEYKPARSTAVLDVARSTLSCLLLEKYESVTTIGFPLSATQQVGKPDFAGHIVFDLNDANTCNKIPCDRKFGLIVFAETIEHLHAAPENVLQLLKLLLAQDGIIICQTPNAAALHKRLQLLFGRNPYEMLRDDPFDPGHIREYTKQELIEIGGRVGLETVCHEYRDYFGTTGSLPRRVATRFVDILCRAFPPFARGQTIIFRARTV